MNILVVEDDLVQSRQFEKHLTGLGHSVQLAFDVQSGWEAAESDPPDVILLDLNIPGGTGLRLLKQRNASSRLRDVPVIVITCVEDPAVRLMAEEHTVEVIFSKPVDYQRLDQTLASVRGRLGPQPLG